MAGKISDDSQARTVIIARMIAEEIQERGVAGAFATVAAAIDLVRIAAEMDTDVVVKLYESMRMGMEIYDSETRELLSPETARKMIDAVHVGAFAAGSDEHDTNLQ